MPVHFAAFMVVVCILGLLEYTRMALPGRRMEGFLATAAGVPLVVLPLVKPTAGIDLFLCGLTASILLFALLVLFRIDDIRRAAVDFALITAGLLYVPVLLSHFILLRYEPHGSSWLFLMMVVVMAGDSTAYYVGSAFGKRKLYPVVSPNKSVEGALGGLAGSVVGAFVSRLVFFPQLGVVDCVVTGILLGLLGQLGDLFESLLKRSFGVKDSGSIVPGHGGILDRLDSLLFAAPAAYYYARFFF